MRCDVVQAFKPPREGQEVLEWDRSVQAVAFPVESIVCIESEVHYLSVLCSRRGGGAGWKEGPADVLVFVLGWER